MTQYRTAFFISDRTGITTETLGNSLLSQFEEIEFKPVILPFVDDEAKAMEAVEAINKTAESDPYRPLVFGTIVDKKIRKMIKSSNAFVIDLFQTFIKQLEEELDTTSSRVVGLSHSVQNDEDYDTRIDAINFALSNDDGATQSDYSLADVILVGVSRSGKTPSSLYLALSFGVFAANYPITEEDMSPLTFPKMLKPFKRKMIGLTIEPERLQAIRAQRRPNSRYASFEQCVSEVNTVEQFFKAEAIPYINSTNRSIEEIATQIMVIKGIERRLR